MIKDGKGCALKYLYWRKEKGIASFHRTLSNNSANKIEIFFLFSTVFTYLTVGVLVGQTSSMTPDYSKAKYAAQRVFSFIASVPPIDNQSDEGLKPVSITLMTLKR